MSLFSAQPTIEEKVEQKVQVDDAVQDTITFWNKHLRTWRQRTSKKGDWRYDLIEKIAQNEHAALTPLQIQQVMDTVCAQSPGDKDIKGSYISALIQKSYNAGFADFELNGTQPLYNFLFAVKATRKNPLKITLNGVAGSVAKDAENTIITNYGVIEHLAGKTNLKVVNHASVRSIFLPPDGKLTYQTVNRQEYLNYYEKFHTLETNQLELIDTNNNVIDRKITQGYLQSIPQRILHAITEK